MHVIGTDEFKAPGTTPTTRTCRAAGRRRRPAVHVGALGLPKGVMITNRNLLTAMKGASQSAWAFDGDAVNLVCMPLFPHRRQRLGHRRLLQRHSGRPRRSPAKILDIGAHHVTDAPARPGGAPDGLERSGADDADFSSLRLVLYGTSPITETLLVRAIRTMGCGFCQAYTETTGHVSGLLPEDHDPGGPKAHLLRSVGLPSPWLKSASWTTHEATGTREVSVRGAAR